MYRCLLRQVDISYGRRASHTKIEYKRFLTSRLRIVYIPMLLWGLPWFLLSLKGAIMVGAAYNTILYFAGGLSIFYFITLIFECYVFYLLSRR